MPIAVVDVRLSLTLKSLFECLARGSRCVIHRHISLALRFVHYAGLASNSLALAQLVEPLDQLAISSEVLKGNLIVRGLVAQYVHGLLLGHDRLLAALLA